jgi:hypothetical protein
VEAGMSRDTAPKLFAVKIALVSIISALKWNKNVSMAMYKTSFGWMRV